MAFRSINSKQLFSATPIALAVMGKFAWEPTGGNTSPPVYPVYDPEITNVSGSISHGQTITITGLGLSQAANLLRIKGDEGSVGSSVATSTGMVVHGTTGNEWVFEAGGTIMLDCQASQPKTVYEIFSAPKPNLFVYYEIQHFNIGPVNGDGNGQIKEVRFNEANDGSHSTNLIVGMIWQRESGLQQFLEGTSSDIEEKAMSVANAGEWRMTTLRGNILAGQVTANIEQYGGGGNYTYTGPALPTPYTGFRQVFLPFYTTNGFAISSRMRNIIIRDGLNGFVIGNNSNPAFWTKKVEQNATTVSTTSAELQLDLQQFSVNDGLYLFVRNSNGALSSPYELRPPVTDLYNPLTDTYGITRPTNNGVTSVMNITDYSAEALAADSVEFQIGFTVTGLDSAVAGTPIGICLTRHSAAGSAYRGHLRIDHLTGAIVIRSMVNNVGLTLAASSDVHTNLGVRRDWKLTIPKNTGGTITLHDMQTGNLIGSAVRTSTFDGWYPTRWLLCDTLAAQGAFKGKFAYLRAFATTAGVTSTIFDYRFTLEQSGLLTVPSTHNSNVIATLGSSLTWGDA